MLSIDDIKNRMSTLTPRELRYFKIMWSKSGVLYIKDRPGCGKTAIIQSIAKKMGFNYMDIRLSMIDETEVGLYPEKITINDNGVEKNFMIHIPAYWAYKANEHPTIVVFEELNRASLQIRNASLQILLERIIGIDFKFNDFVLFCATGNIGMDDGTDVNDFDSALNNRLIHVEQNLTPKEWLEEFAMVDDNIHYTVIEFIKNNNNMLFEPENNLKNGTVSDAHRTPRSWTFLSNYIKTWCEDTNDIIEFLNESGKSYIGIEGSNTFRRFVENSHVTLNDVIKNFDNIKYKIKNNSIKMKIINEIDITCNNWSENEVDNFIEFTKLLNPEQISTIVTFMINKKSKDGSIIKIINENSLLYNRIKTEYKDILISIIKSISSF